MCDFQKRNVLDFHCDRKKMRFIKKSRWELSNQKSTFYWNEICNNLEKKIRKVRNPFSHFPFISHSNNNLDFDPHDSAKLNNLSKVQSYDEPIFKVSPPTPLRKLSFISTTDLFKDRSAVDKKYTDLDKNLILKLRSLIENRKNNALSEYASFDKTYVNKKKIFSNRICPYHKNDPPLKIFDDDLKKRLPRREYIAKKSFHRTSRSSSGLCSSDSKKVSKKGNEILKGFESAALPEAQIESRPIQNSMNLSMEEDSKVEYEIEKNDLSDTQKATKTPKLGKASLLASFAKKISIPSSVETHESSDEDYSKSDINLDLPFAEKCDSESKSEEELRSSKSVSKDYLKVPKLGYASLHPSFRKLLPIDSFPNEEEIIVNNFIPKIVSEYSLGFGKTEETLINQETLKFENSLEVSSVASSNIENTVGDDSTRSPDLNKSDTRKLLKLSRRQNYSTRYAYRALNLLTKDRNLKFFPEDRESGLEKKSFESSSSSGSIEPEYKIREYKAVKLDSTTHKDIREKLRTVAPKYLGQNYLFSSKKSEEIRTIFSTTRSTSGSSPAFQNPQLKSRPLTRIPSIKIYPRKNSDRCLPCLYKTFKDPQKPKRELPMAILSSIVKEPLECVSVSESDTSSLSLPDFKSCDFEYLISDRGFDRGSNLESSKKRTEVMFKKEEADRKSEISQDNESILSKDYSLSPKSTDLKKMSIKSGSAQSTDISKPSTPSGQSSESEDARPEVTNDTLNTSKYLAPCHAPLVWKPSLEPLRALRLRKATSMQSRASAVTLKSYDDSDLEDSLIEISSPQDARKRDRKAQFKTVTILSPDSKIYSSDKETDTESKANLIESGLKKKRKMLVRTKTVAGQMDISKTDEEKKGRFVRAKTSIDLISKISDARKIFFDLDDSVEDSRNFNKDLLKLKEDSKNEEKLLELSKEDQEVLEILEKCIEEDKSPGDILKKLCDWYSTRISEIRKGDTDPNLKRALKISLNLLRLLVESRRFLNSDKLSPDLKFSSKQPPVCNSRQLRRILPLKSYNLVAPILDMPLWHPKKLMENKAILVKSEFFKKERRKSSILTYDLFVHPPSVTEPSLDEHGHDSQGLNPYARFLVKPRRKVVIWRPLRKKDLKGYNPDATLHNRATQITEKICREFCEWLRGLSGNLERIDEEVLKDMFQITFTAEACKSMQVFFKEMPTVPKPIALTRNSAYATELGMTRKELILDSKIAKKPEKTFAFGTALPKKLRFIPPKNQVDTKWLSSKNVPEELETMDAVWNGIQHLESVKQYVQWLKTNTNVSPPEILKYEIQNAVSLSRFSQEDMITQVDFDGGELEILNSKPTL